MPPSAVTVAHMLFVLSSIENKERKQTTTPRILYNLTAAEIVQKAREIYHSFAYLRRKKPSGHVIGAFSQKYANISG